MVYVDEKWLKIRGRWQYWFVVLDVTTELPDWAPYCLAPPVGLSLARRTTAQLKKIPGSSSRMGYRPTPPGAGAKHGLVSLSSPAGCHPLVTAAFYDRGRDEQRASR